MENLNQNLQGGKKLFTKRNLVIILIAVIFISLIAVVYSKDSEEEETVVLAKQVKTMILGSTEQDGDAIRSVGTVMPETSVDVVALVSGTVRGIFFNSGDDVYMNQILVNMQSDSVSTSYSNSQINYLNMLNNLDAVKRIADENIRKAELGVTTAAESVKSAEIALKAAQDNLANSSSLQDKGVLDTQDGAIISFYDYVNNINNTLDQIDYLIGAEIGTPQLDSAVGALGAKNVLTLSQAKTSYHSARAAYDIVHALTPTRSSILDDMDQVSNALDLTKQAVDDVINLLNNSIATDSFPEESLTAQKTVFTGVRSTVIGMQTGADTIRNSLENLGLTNIQQTDALENAVSAAQSQLQIAQVSYDNALASLESAKQSKEQQLITAQTQVDSAQGQLNLSGTQVSDLIIKSPIDGKITYKAVELGSEVNAGQKIAEVSKTDQVKIELSLSSEDIYRIELGQEVTVNDDITATISSIDPAADPVTKKVKIEILVDNSEGKLISGTFVDVSIPVKKLEKTSANSLFIPLKAINALQNDNIVFLVKNDVETGKNIAREVSVETGKTQANLIEVTSGLREGDELIISGNKDLENNDIIEISN